MAVFVSEKHRIPSLDGLRASSILMVLLSHVIESPMLPQTGVLHAFLSVIGQGGLGVTVFFVISGFLITTLLLQEIEKSSTISLRAFYLRRAFRIFPPYYCFILVAVLTQHVLASAPSLHTVLASVFYFANYYPYAYSHPETTGWVLAHTWSLSVEEQFYLLWPAILLFAGARRAYHVALASIFIVPILRWLTYLYFPVYHLYGQTYRLFHTTFDTLMFGCLLAYLLRAEKLRRLISRPATRYILAGMLAYLAGFTFLSRRTPFWWTALFGLSLASLCIVGVIAYVVLNPEGWLGRLLNTRILRHIGVLSYSIYLWQQLFTKPGLQTNLWLRMVVVFVVAEASYWLVERPTFSLRRRFV